MSALATADLSRCAVESRATAGARRAWLYPVLSCAVVLACILIANPFNEAGFNDDWSYARVAMKLAGTGRLQYNGWGSPILLFQSYWAAPWILAFGFSMQVLQVAMIPVSLGFVALVYATGRATGLSRELSAFASIATGTSPLFLPLAASFMTDSPGCLFCMLCVYSALRSAQATNSREATRWLWVLALAGVIGGANRQVVWIAPVSLIPYLLWTRRSDSTFRMHAVAAYSLSGIVILAILHFLSQPYGPLQLNHEQLMSVFRNGSGKAINLAASLILVCVFASLPAFCCLVPLARRRLALMLISLVPLTIATFALLVFTGLAAPYGNGIFSWVGIATEGQEWFRTKPATLPPWARIGLSVATSLCVIVSARWLVRSIRSFPVFAVFCLGYMALLLPGILLGFAFDRYMLPILPLMMLVVLKHSGNRVPAVAWCCIAAFACYGIATTHDYSAALRARIAAAHEFAATGVGRDRVSVGFEYDGWTELERSEYVSVVQYADLFADDHAKGLWFWFWNHTPHLTPDYVALNWNSPERARGGEIKVGFQAWLPPFQRSAVVWRRSDLTGALQAARITATFR